MTNIVPLTIVTQVTESNAPEPVSAAADLSSIQGGVITIGNFDGVHLGHATLLRNVHALARRLGGPAVAVVLDPHPATILRPEAAPVRLTSIERRAELMDRLGIDTLVVCQTNAKFLSLTAEEFFRSLVIERLQARAMIEGPNFFFGRNRGGDIAVLKGLCEAEKIDLEIVPPTSVEGEMISSTRIRELLSEGRVEEAARLLGTRPRIRGTVARGVQRGREIGYPTANLINIDVFVPSPGVYGGMAQVDGREVPAAIHIGPNPTFEHDGETKVEIHLLDFDGDLYGQVLKVDFVTRVRGVTRFESADRLIQQLQQDITIIRSRLSSV